MLQRVFAKCKKMGDYFICIILHLPLSLLSGAVGHETIWEDDSPDKALWTRTYRRLVQCCVQYNVHVCFLVLNKFVFVPLDHHCCHTSYYVARDSASPATKLMLAFRNHYNS